MEELAREIMPDIICFNIGIADVKQENLAWNPNRIPKEFIARFKDLIITFQSYFLATRAPFIEKFTYTFNMLPSYCHSDAIIHNQLPMELVTDHTEYWGTSYHNIKRDFAREVGNEINRRLHLSEQEMFGKYYCLILNPTPRWAYDGLGIDSHSGLPYPTRHREIIGNFSSFCKE